MIIDREGIEEPELVYASEANTEIPQLVIKFYESKLTWHEHQGGKCDVLFVLCQTLTPISLPLVEP